jgi:S-adenosylmethionine hydrolase
VNPCGIITFTSDFGLEDAYVGIVKGVILGINPRARVVDITHQVSHGSIPDAAFLLQDACRFFPEGTVHLAVIDPGVGTARRSIAIQTEHCFFVGPDNGLFWPIIDRDSSSRIVSLEEERYFRSEVSDTFHGRDIFAPVAAHLSAGLAFHLLGPKISNPTFLACPLPEIRKDRLLGRVIRVDHFGNLITNIDKETLENFLENEEAVIRIGRLRIPGVGRTYEEASPGGVIALVGSAGFLEVAVHLGRADGLDGLKTDESFGREVIVTRSGPAG